MALRSLGSSVRDATFARRAIAGLADLLLPVACVSCDRLLDAGEAGIVCGRCWSRLVALPFPQCTRCGHPIGRYSCRWCPQLPPYVRAVRSVCWMGEGTGGAIVHALKYHGWSRAADGIAERMARLAWPRDVIDERAVVVPVPLSRDRERARGFNQSALLAGALATRWRIPLCSDVIERDRGATSQTRLTPEERRRNVAGAIRAAPNAPRRLRGQHVVLVDDVVTTAATLSACAAALVAGGARIVSCVTFGRARV